MENINILISIFDFENLPEIDTLIRSIIPDVNILVVTSSAAARISLLNQVFDLIILDDGMWDLATFIRKECPGNQSSRLMLISKMTEDYYQASKESPAAQYYLKIPFTIDSFRMLFLEIIKSIKGNKKSITSTDPNRQALIAAVNEYWQTTNAACVFISDRNGSILYTYGDPGNLKLPVMATLLSGSMATLIEAGHKMGKVDGSLNFFYHEGEDHCVYSINVGSDHLLNTIMDTKNPNNKVGMIWFYAKPASQKLSKLLVSENPDEKQTSLHTDLSSRMVDEFDKLLSPNESVKRR